MPNKDVKKAAMEICKKCFNRAYKRKDYAGAAMALLIQNAIDSLDADDGEEVNRAHWIEHHTTGLGPALSDCIECSSCGVWFTKDHMIRNTYCPNCGSIMGQKGGV